ncbi:MAG: exodeoxyribonuclease V subunit alpha [Lysobacteraceae bacterium]
MSLLRELERGGWLRAVDHAFATSLLRLDPDTSDAVASAAALTSRALANGHSCLRIAHIAELLLELAPDRPQPALPARAEWLAALRASRWVGVASADRPEDRLHGVPLVLEHDALYLRRYRDYEWRLAKALTARCALPSLDANDTELGKRMRALFPAPDAHATLDLQALAALLALSSPLTLITGGPGTGKTSVIARLLVLLVEHSQRIGDSLPRITLAAPTGKAAARLAEAVRENLDALLTCGAITRALFDAIPASAQTVHRLLGWRSDSIEFRHDAANPLPADVVIIDEASMIDLPLMTRLVDAVSPQARLILLGDRDQLASVETGDVLASLCDAAGDGRAFSSAFATRAGALLDGSVPVLVNDNACVDSVLAGHRVDLQRSYRQHADFDLAPLAAAVRTGDAHEAIHGLQTQAYRSVEWLQPDGHDPWQWLQTHALPRFRALAQADNPEVALHMAREFRLLTALRHGPCGNETMNSQIASALRPRGEGAFHGQLLMVTQNNYALGLFNGDTGVVWGEGAAAQVFFQAEAGLRAWPLAQLPAHEAAWALTVHKAQGSEFERAVLLLPNSDARVLGRELLYTGITRCRSNLVLWASESTLRNAISRRGQRASGLAQRFTERSTAHTDTPSEQASR